MQAEFKNHNQALAEIADMARGSAGTGLTTIAETDMQADVMSQDVCKISHRVRANSARLCTGLNCSRSSGISAPLVSLSAPLIVLSACGNDSTMVTIVLLLLGGVSCACEVFWHWRALRAPPA